VVLVGLDGFDWRVADPLMAAGRMPHLATLVERGVRARLRTMPPALSPVLWTTIATGQRPERHGIVDFLAQPEGGGQPVPVTSTLRRVPALWNLVSAAGLRAGVVGWWATYPAEEIDGYVVSDRVAYQLFGLGDDARAGGGGERVWPPGLADEVRGLVITGDELAGEDLRVFFGDAVDAATLDPALRELHDEFRRYLASHRTYTAAAALLSARESPDLDMLYLELPDTAGHLFMPFRPPRMPGVREEQVRLFGEVVDRVYEEVDRVIGTVIARSGPEAVYVVCSDHGFRSGEDRPRTLGSRIGSGGAARWHRRDGILVIAGPGVREGVALGKATILDVAPTVLAALGLPVPEDMEG
jgi:predicted AlkP superfamily phosphohydrolase/phosphomutase